MFFAVFAFSWSALNRSDFAELERFVAEMDSARGEMLSIGISANIGFGLDFDFSSGE